MARPRPFRVFACALIGVIALAGIVVFAVAKRPVTTPRYPAEAWTGTGGTHTGWLDLDSDSSVLCWYVANGSMVDPDARVGLVLPDSYRAFKPSLVERGTAGPAPFISGSSIWAADEYARFLGEVTLKGRPAVGEGWLADARAQWDRLCDPSVETVIVVQPGTLATPGAGTLVP